MATYRGQDRRAPFGGVQPGGRQLWLAVALLVTVAVTACSFAATARAGGVKVHELNGVLATSCAVVAFVAGFVSCLRWRMSGNSSALQIGAALVLLGALVVAVALVPFLGFGFAGEPVLARLDTAMWLAVVGLFGVGVVTPPIDSTASGGRLFLCVSASVGALVAIMYAVPPFATAAQSVTAPVNGVGGLLAHLAVVVVWTVAASISLIRGLRRSSWLWTWLGLMLFGFAVAGAFNALATSRDDLWSTGALLMRLLALLFVLNGVAQELKLAFLDQRSLLFDSRLTVEASEMRRRVEEAEHEERAHEARSAILGIEAAARTLTAGAGNGASGDDAELRSALETEIELLRLLVEGDRGCMPLVAFDVSAAIWPAVVCKRAAGFEVTCEREPGIRAFGRPAVLTEIVQGLLDNARDHAVGTPVVVRTALVGGRVVVRVEDRGPGIAQDQRERIFRRGSSSGRPGRGLGLSIARRLLLEQDGDIHVESRPGGGASFVVTLMSASPPVGRGASTELVHQGHDARQLGDGHALHAHGGHQ